MKPVIRVKNVNFTYNKGKDNEFQALINVSLDIYPEEYVIIFGPSGCGKSTLLNIFAGLEIPNTGIVEAFDKDLANMSRRENALYHRRKIGMIYQAYNLITSLTVLDNVALPQIFINSGKKEREVLGLKLLERFGILKQARKIPTELSGGQQQRIGLARAIINNPEIVLADEPVGNLDSVSAKNVLNILNELNEKEKKTIIMVTHNPEYLEFGDRIVYMKDGIITREVVSKDKKKLGEKKDMRPKSPTAEINDLMRAYHGMTPEQINILIMPYKAKVFVHHFITDRNMEETKIFEDLIHRRLLGTVSEEELYKILRRPANKGGVGYDKRTAAKIIRRVNRVIRTAYYIYQKGRQRRNEQGGHDKITRDEKAKRVTEYLLKTCYTKHYKKLDKLQIYRLQQAVKDRLVGSIQKNVFFNYLDLPFKDSGVGLNRKTAKVISEELELILILGYGIVQMNALKSGGDKISTDMEKEAEDDKDFPAREKSADMVRSSGPKLEEDSVKKGIKASGAKTDEAVDKKSMLGANLVQSEKGEVKPEENGLIGGYAKGKESERVEKGSDIEKEIFTTQEEIKETLPPGIRSDFRDRIIRAENIAQKVAKEEKVAGPSTPRGGESGALAEESKANLSAPDYTKEDAVRPDKSGSESKPHDSSGEKEKSELENILKKNKVI